jgi:hypothetical protein
MFWTSISTQLALAPMPVDRRIEALKWLGECAAAPGRADAREEIVRALGEGVLQALKLFDKHDLREVRPIVLRMLLPLVETELVSDTDWTFRRLVGYVTGLGDRGRGVQNYHFRSEDGREVQVAISEAEIEGAAIETFRSEEVRRITSPRISPAKIEISVTKAVTGRDRTVTVRTEVPLIHLLFAEDTVVPQSLVTLISEHLRIVDPPLAAAVAAHLEALTSTDEAGRRDARVAIGLKYLDGFSFLMKRDPRHGLKRLSEMGLTGLDEYLGLGMTSTEGEPQLPIVGGPLGADVIPLATWHSLLFLTLPYAQYRALAEGLVPHVLEDEPIRRERRLGGFAAEARFSANVFTGVAMFFNLAFLVCRSNVVEFEVEGARRFNAVDWLKDYVVFMLQASSIRGNVDAEEIARRQTHAYTLQLSVWAAASQRHVAELGARTSSPDDVVSGWLLRGLILSDRMLPVFLADSDWTVAEMPSQLRKVADGLGITINTELYPDVFNPFIYGPGGYDHAL